MRQKAVSIAPQNEAPIQIAPMAAITPIVAELSRIRSTTLVSESCSAAGKMLCRSRITLASISGFSITRPKMNSSSRAKGKSASARL
jgi:hypothetical protein